MKTNQADPNKQSQSAKPASSTPAPDQAPVSGEEQESTPVAAVENAAGSVPEEGTETPIEQENSANEAAVAEGGEGSTGATVDGDGGETVASDLVGIEEETGEVPAVMLADGGDDESTGALGEAARGLSKITTPLPEAAGPPRPPLAEDSTVEGRYQVSVMLGSVGETNLYRVIDQQGYLHCWACGSSSSMPGDIYCVECGAQLAGRHYRLQEFKLPLLGDEPITGVVAIDEETGQVAQSDEISFLPQLPIAHAILENRVQGVAHAYDVWYDLELGRGYVAWEEAGGRVMASWLPGMNTTGLLVPAGQSGHLAVPEEPEEEQALGWMTQVGELLTKLYAEGIGGCNLELTNLLVQPGDRVMLLDPSACQSLEGLDDDAREILERSDVRALAGHLEQWYLAVRRQQVDGQDGDDTGDPFATSNAQVAASARNGKSGNGQMVAAYEATGPLGGDANPAVVLAKAREGTYPTAESFTEILRELYHSGRPLTNLKLWSGRTSDIGMVRKINEDSVLTLEATVMEHEGNLPVGLYVVSDGMGGHQSGEVASSIAARTVGALVNSSLIGPLVSGDPVARDPNTCAHLLRQAVLEANRRISDLARERHSDLGTTTVAGLLIGNQLTVVNVGDSRAYLYRDGQLTVLTRDHSLVMQLVLAGQIALEDIYTHPRRNEIYRALGDSRLGETEIDVYRYKLRPGDGLLLCSDGLWDFVRDPEIAAIVGVESNDPQTIANSLVDMANSRGGEDNISVVYVRLMQGAE
ncbi:MAG: PP2C family serine/threonine-protein phosphatase [Chloroflexota bacterium]